MVMGGDPFAPMGSLTEEESLMGDDLLFVNGPKKSSFSSEDLESLNTKLENDSLVSEWTGFNLGVYRDAGYHTSPILEAKEKQRCNVYAEVLRSYEEMQSRTEWLEEAKLKVLSYTPGSRIEKLGDLCPDDYAVPDNTTLLLIGPKGSGKSSLINKISRVLEKDVFGLERAQVTHNPLSGNGTHFLGEYNIPRGSEGSFCLFDTRSLFDDNPSENFEMVKGWMTFGVHHGKIMQRQSDSRKLQVGMCCKDRGCYSARRRTVNFVILVVNGLSVLESMNEADDTKNGYSQLIATTFKNPFVSFRDDKPVVVVTHGDLLSLSDRVRIRVYLGELLGIPPTKQIFDIPASRSDEDSTTTLTIVDMLNYSLDRADRNFPGSDKDTMEMRRAIIIFFLVLGLFLTVIHIINTYTSHSRRPPPSVINSGMKFPDWREVLPPLPSLPNSLMNVPDCRKILRQLVFGKKAE